MSAGAGTGNTKPVTEKKVEIPQDQPPSAKAAAPLAALSSEIDPAPHYIMSAACAGGAGWAYSRMNNPRAAAVAGGFSLLYLFAGRLLAQGHDRLGYDLGTAASVGLLATAGPTAYATGEAYVTTMATLGGVSGIANFIKSYQMRTGKPHEASVKDKH